MRDIIEGVAIIIGGFLFLFWVTGGPEQVAAAQKARTEFAQRCADRQGTVVRMRKSSVSRVCVGPDGRWLEYY